MSVDCSSCCSSAPLRLPLQFGFDRSSCCGCGSTAAPAATPRLPQLSLTAPLLRPRRGSVHASGSVARPRSVPASCCRSDGA
eukprot:15040362-Alexandrium_andersonii.AAC.1